MTIGPPARLLFAAFMLVGLLPQASLARTEESLIWTQKADGSFITLAYGPLDPGKHAVFMLSCFNDMDIAVLDVRTEMPDASHGDPLTIELTAAGLTSPVEAEATHDEASGITFGEASDIAVKPIIAVLRAPGPLTVTIGEASATLSDHNRAEAVDKFSQDCKLN